jgi:hypothetical protein
MAQSQSENTKDKNTTAKVVGFTTGGVVVLGVAYFLLKDDINALFSKKTDTKEEPATIINNYYTNTASSSTSKTKSTTQPKTNTKAEAKSTTFLTDAEALDVAKQIRAANYIAYRTPSQRDQAIIAGAKKLIPALYRMNNIQDYVSVNNHFLKIGFDLVRKSIVTKTFETYGAYPGTRAIITKHFVRMGLKHNPDGKWTLSGLDGIGCPKHSVENVYGLCEQSQEQIFVPANSYVGQAFQEHDEITHVVSPSGLTMLYPSKSIA